MKKSKGTAKTMRKSKYKFAKLAVGQSFRVKGEDMKLIRNNATSFTRRHGAQFSVHKTTENSGKCVRVA